MKPTPAGWPRVSASVFYDDAVAAIDWLCHAFGFEVRLKVEGEGGRIEHSELTFGEGLVMVGSVKDDKPWATSFASPRSVGGKCTQALCIFVDDVDAHCARARKAGASISMEPETHDYGDDYWTDRTYQATDLEGHRWWFIQRLSTPAAQSA
jgi:uncharacterized glyoxalase superfamily protein PhnB